MKELQHVMATLAFKSNTECATYKVSSFKDFMFTFLIFFLTVGAVMVSIFHSL